MNHKLATSFGIFALILWAAGSPFIASLNALPRFELQSVVFSLSFVIFICIFRLKLVQSLKHLPWQVIVLCSVSLYLHNMFLVLAFKYAPAEKAELINYLWPILVILFSSLLPHEKLRKAQLLGAVLAFCGILCLLAPGFQSTASSSQEYLGYLFAFLDALSWCAFTLFSRIYVRTHVSGITGIYCGICAILAIINHLLFEVFVMPSHYEIAVLSLMALTSQGFAFYFWDLSIKFGNYRLLCVLSYFTPVLSVYLLILSGFTTHSSTLWLAAGLVSMGALIACEPAAFLNVLRKSPLGYHLQRVLN